MGNKDGPKNTMVREFTNKMITDFAALKPDYDLAALAERFAGCKTWPQLDRAICDFIAHRQPFPISEHQQNIWPPEAIEALEKLRQKREGERNFWEGKRREIAEISGIGRGIQAPPAEPATAPLKEVETSRLTKLQKEKIGDLKENPGGFEFAFFKRLIGMTPAQARQAMADEYVSRFKPNLEFGELLKVLSPGRTWLKLDLGIERLLALRREMFEKLGRSRLNKKGVSAVLSMELNQQFDLELDFWDKMRHLIYALPKPREFSNKFAKQQDLKKSRPAKGWHYDTCVFCWRMVPYNPVAKPKTILCFEHDLNSDHPLYRKHFRLAKGVLKLCFDISKRLKPWRDMRITDEEEQKMLVHMMTSADSPLPLLVKYLKAQGHDGTPKSLLMAFHGPFSDKTPVTYKRAMEEFFQEVLATPPFVTAYEICLAEAWLSAYIRVSGKNTNAIKLLPTS